MHTSRTRRWIIISAGVVAVFASLYLLLLWSIKRDIDKGFQALLDSNVGRGLTLMQEAVIATRVQEYFRENHEFPASLESLELDDAARKDVWGNPFRLIRIHEEKFVVQSLGTAKKDALHPALVNRLKAAPAPSQHILGGNIILVVPLSGPVFSGARGAPPKKVVDDDELFNQQKE